MKKILLTSTGFDNENIKNKFMKLINKNISDVCVLFIITAANDPDSIRILSGCLDDLTKCGIIDENITVYDMHKLLPIKDINNYDVIYVCGGSTKKLVDRIKEVNFKSFVDAFINNGGIYIGVSAGSIASTNQGLGLMNNKLDVHCDKGTNNGIVSTLEDIYLTDNQALYITDNIMEVFE